MNRDCIHGQLARSCELCGFQATIVVLESERDEALAIIERAKVMTVKAKNLSWDNKQRLLDELLALLNGEA